MAKVSKRVRAIKEKLVPGKVYNLTEALEMIKNFSAVKFNESVDIAVMLGIDAKKSEQLVRGSTLLPHGTGSTVRVAVFAQGNQAELAKAAGADIVGYEDLVEDIKAGKLEADVVIATPDAMPLVGQVGQILGPRGLMPNPKLGTVAVDVATAVKNAKAGQVRYRTDKNGIIHCLVGKVNFEVAQLQENINALIADLKKARPATAKGVYLKKITLSSTMGPGLVIEQTNF